MSLPEKIEAIKGWKKEPLRKIDLDENPFQQLERWMKEVEKSKLFTYPNAMHLATLDKAGFPNVRVVLLKEIRQNELVFFSNYESQKGEEINVSPRVCVNFYWPYFERQVRISGAISRVPRSESEGYFTTRPVGSQVGAWVSPQSQTIPNKSWLISEVESFCQGNKLKNIDCPPHWGGYAIDPSHFEFWQAGEYRIHDRICYQKTGNGSFTKYRKAP